MRVLVLAGCVSVLVSLCSAFKITDFINNLIDGKDNKRQDTFPAGGAEQILPATFALTFSASLVQNLIELYDNQAIATATQGKNLYLYIILDYTYMKIYGM